MTEERKHDFDSCSRKELTMCIKSSIKRIREIKKLVPKIQNNYPGIAAELIMRELVLKDEIKNLLDMRRVMKNNNLSHWRDYNNARNSV